MKKMIMTLSIMAGLLFPAVIAVYAQEAPSGNLVTVGTGKRTKFPIGTVYLATLHVPQEWKGKDGVEIVKADVPMSVVLQIDTGMLSRERFVDAIREGFDKSKGAGFATDKTETFLSLFRALEFHKGDTIFMNYTPATGLATAIQTTGTTEKKNLGTVEGLAFKKALFAIWLGPSPVQDGLKKGMLGQ